MALNNQGQALLFSGNVFLQNTDSTDNCFIDVGNATELTITPNSELKERISRRKDSYGSALDSVVIKAPTTFSMTLDCLAPANLAKAWFGAKGTVTQTASTVTGEAVNVLAEDCWFDLANGDISNVSAALKALTGSYVVTSAGSGAYDDVLFPAVNKALDAAGETVTLTFTSATDYTVSGSVSGALAAGSTTADYDEAELFIPSAAFSGVFAAADTVVFTVAADTALVLDVDYQLEPISGMILFCSTGAVNAASGTYVAVGYDAADQTADHQLVLGDSENRQSFAVRVCGINLATNKHMVLNIDQVIMSPTSGFNLFDTEFATVQFTGSIISGNTSDGGFRALTTDLG